MLWRDNASCASPKPALLVSSPFDLLELQVSWYLRAPKNRVRRATFSVIGHPILFAISMDGKRKLGTDEIVARAMEEEEGRKKQKKGAAPAQQGITTIPCHTVTAAT